MPSIAGRVFQEEGISGAKEAQRKACRFQRRKEALRLDWTDWHCKEMRPSQLGGD